MSKKIRGSISVRFGVIIPGMKAKYSVDPGTSQDLVESIALAEISALSPRNTSAIYVSHHNIQPPMLPDSLRYLEQNQGGRAGLLPGGLGRRLLPYSDDQ